MSQPESKLSRKIMDALRQEGAFVFKVWGSEHMMSGLPDLVGCWKGRFFGLEVKMPDKRNNVTPRQLLVGTMIKAAGGIWKVVCSATEAYDTLKSSEKTE